MASRTGPANGSSANSRLSRVHRAVISIVAALLALAGTAAIALAQGGAEPPPPAGELPADTPKRKALYKDGHVGRFLLAGRWYYRADPGDQGAAQGLAADPSLAGWSETRIPNAWNATDLSDASQRGTVGWYRKDFRLPSRAAALAWKVRFESVNYRAKVWLNGVELGEHEFAYVPFELLLRGLDRRGVNRLVVRVDNRRDQEDIPRGYERANGRPGGGWWNYGGILREVYLRRVDGADIEAVHVRPRLAPNHRSARLDFRVTLHNPHRRRVRVGLETRLEGTPHRIRPRRIAPGARRTLSYRLKVERPRLWRVLRPSLYRVRISTTAGKRLLGNYRLKVGIRDVRVERGIVRINGRRVKLMGANLHEDHPRRGAALSPADRKRDMRTVRELGATIIRAHYPLHPRYLEMADRAGVMVWDQIPVWQQGYRRFASPVLLQKALDYLRAMIERDRNHPSVLAWSIANELSPRMTRDQARYIRRAGRLMLKLDPTRLRTIDIFGYPHTPPADVYQHLDGIGINSYFGWYPGPNGQVADRDRLGPYLDQMRSYYPDLALFVTEFGAEANRAGPETEKGTYAFQREWMRHHIRTYLRTPFLNGAINWVMRDFRMRPDWEGGNPKPSPPWNQKGLVDELWRKKPAFAEVARLYKSTHPKPPKRRKRR